MRHNSYNFKITSLKLQSFASPHTISGTKAAVIQKRREEPKALRAAIEIIFYKRKSAQSAQSASPL